jgi:O-acetyl-ADP-ribose deacetylase (regulator of RNase III)
LLASAYRRSLEVATEHKLTSIAFPAISTGIYGYPLTEAAPIALRTVNEFVGKQQQIKLVRFVLFSTPILEIFAQTLTKLVQEK